MTHFLRLLADTDKGVALQTACARLRSGNSEPRHFQVETESFDTVPGKPFAYWVSDDVRKLFSLLPPFESDGRTMKQGLATGDDFRFVRAWWEVGAQRVGEPDKIWFPFAKGGTYSPFYADVYLVVNWGQGGEEIKEEVDRRYSHIKGYQTFWVVKNPDWYFRPGLTWGDRTSSYLSVKPWPAGGVFSVKGSAGFFPKESLYFAMALMNSRAFNAFLEMLVNAGSAVSRSYQVGIIGNVPYPNTSQTDERMRLLARMAWSLKRKLDTITETSHAFLLPHAMRTRLADYDSLAIQSELTAIMAEIDRIAFEIYGFSDDDRQAALSNFGVKDDGDNDAGEDLEEDDELEVPTTDALLSWGVGVAFGRFDWRLATGEREAPPEPDPFDPWPTKSPGMLPDGTDAFHAHAGVLVDDQGHPHDLARLVEEVFARVEVTVPDDARRWLQREFFGFHLQRYSKSRRKAPIFWPLATTSGSYTLWLYYPSLTSETLYTAINDFIEPKLKQVGGDVTVLRNKGATRTREDEKQFEALQAFELELIELRDTLLKLAPTYKPRHDDGVQITAAPLWPLFRHKPWQKVLKETWSKLEKGAYDWSHLAMNYWPARVREKCKTDKSLAIAHGLEILYVEPEAAPKKPRGRRKGAEHE